LTFTPQELSGYFRSPSSTAIPFMDQADVIRLPCEMS
jgi:hypothetical protein